MTSYELINDINNLENSKYLKEYDAYIIKIEDKKGVAIPVSNEVLINEAFNKVFIENVKYEINKTLTNLIYLFTKEKEMNEHYGCLCLDFLELSKRESIKINPFCWFLEWSKLIGNTEKSKMIYDVIGEMSILNELLENNLNPSWESMKQATFDISTNKYLFEVKSTISKSTECITIHNQFQLESDDNKPVYIAYVKLEDNGIGISIDDLANEIIRKGFEKNDLEEYLSKIGYAKGKNERYKQYLVHEIRYYLVDDKFPKITKESFKENKIPTGVVKYEYTISLSGLNYNNLKEVINGTKI